MNQIVTTAIILRRTDYGEADRILTLLTPDHGKLRVMAKGVRRSKSKLAGGIELFSVSKISYIKGRGEIGTLVSAQLNTHYGNIVKDINRTMLGYDLIKQLDKTTEDELEDDYFGLLQAAFDALNDATISLEIIKMWFSMQMLKLGGHMPNLQSDLLGDKLQADQTYSFQADASTFVLNPQGKFTASHIKLLRLGFSAAHPKLLSHVQGGEAIIAQLEPIIFDMRHEYLV